MVGRALEHISKSRGFKFQVKLTLYFEPKKTQQNLDYDNKSPNSTSQYLISLKAKLTEMTGRNKILKQT